MSRKCLQLKDLVFDRNGKRRGFQMSIHHWYQSEECISRVKMSAANVIYLRCIVVVVMYLENDENEHIGPQKPSAKSFPLAQSSNISFSKHVLGSRFIGGSVKGLHWYDPSYGSSRVVSCRQLAFFCHANFWYFCIFSDFSVMVAPICKSRYRSL